MTGLKKRVVAIVAVGLFVALVVWAGVAVDRESVTYSGKVVARDGSPVRGATVSLFTSAESHSVSVYSQADGTFRLPEMAAEDYKLRVRLIGLHDEWLDLKVGDPSSDLEIAMKPASGWDLQLQRPPST